MLFASSTAATAANLLAATASDAVFGDASKRARLLQVKAGTLFSG